MEDSITFQTLMGSISKLGGVKLNTAGIPAVIKDEAIKANDEFIGHIHYRLGTDGSVIVKKFGLIQKAEKVFSLEDADIDFNGPEGLGACLRKISEKSGTSVTATGVPSFSHIDTGELNYVLVKHHFTPNGKLLVDELQLDQDDRLTKILEAHLTLTTPYLKIVPWIYGEEGFITGGEW